MSKTEANHNSKKQRKWKPLHELTIKDDFMFGAVMSDENNCKKMLERVLDMEIEYVVVDRQKNFVYNPQYKGIRLDIIARDENHTCYNVEMQMVRPEGLAERTRYYHSQLDMDMLATGASYTELPPAYVIFICNFDPFGEGLYRYTFCKKCEERRLQLRDGATTIFLSTKGTNEQEVSAELVRFLRFVEADLEASTKDFRDPYIEQLQQSVSKVKITREMGVRYMKLQLLIQEEYAKGHKEGRAEGHAEGRVEGEISGIVQTILFLLQQHGNIPDEVRAYIEQQSDAERLLELSKIAATVSSVEAFAEQIMK